MVIMNLPNRKSPRIPGFDYSSVNFYFITICTHEKQCIFGNPGELNRMGKCAEECLLKIPQIHPQIRLDKYVVMPNHIHAIFDVQQSEKKDNLNVVIGQYKMAVTKRIREKKPEIQVWQRSFHDHVIRNYFRYEKIWCYIEDNPRKWEEDCFYMAAE
jgi:REP element-mobilizing transposase RayT